jgi:hypothetical protein
VQANMIYNFFIVQKCSLVLCGRWEHCSKVIHWPGVCCCPVLSVVRKVSEVKIHVVVEQRIIIIFLMKSGCKLINLFKIEEAV